MLGQGSSESGSDPRNDSFWKFSKDFCCPSFSFLSAAFIISCIDIVIYLATLAIGGIKKTPSELLAPTFDTLDSFGMKVSVLFILRYLLKFNKGKFGV
jgi:hypothetical protein